MIFTLALKLNAKCALSNIPKELLQVRFDYHELKSKNLKLAYKKCDRSN